MGGYFGARLAQAGKDVTFLVRERRRDMLRQQGVVVRSPRGDLHIRAPNLMTTGELVEPFDVVLLACKAYDLDTALEAISPAVGQDTRIVPLLNGMQHLDELSRRFGKEKILGGVAVISADVDDAGTILHLNDLHTLAIGPLRDQHTDAATMVMRGLEGAAFDLKESRDAELDMWEKWVFIATAAGGTCLLRAPVGDIVTAQAQDILLSMFDECVAIAAHNGFHVRSDAIQRARTVFGARGSPFAASMLRDLERGSRTEAEQVVGDLLRRADDGSSSPLLRTAYAHLRTYEARRARNSS